MKKAFFPAPLFFLFLTLLLLLVHPSAQALTGKVNINTATVKELKQLPFVGETRAKAIVRYRNTHGPFISIDELKNIPAIGLGTYEAIRPYLTISTHHSLEPHFQGNSGSLEVSPTIKTSPGEIVTLRDSDYFDTLVSYLRGAQHSINMTMFIFKTTSSPQNRPSMIVQELIRARKRGVSIHVTLDNSGYDEGVNRENKKVARKLKKNNITVRMDSEKTTTHAKIVVIDNQFSFVGSHNMTHSALTRNNELSLLVDSRLLAEELLEYMRGIK